MKNQSLSFRFRYISNRFTLNHSEMLESYRPVRCHRLNNLLGVNKTFIWSECWGACGRVCVCVYVCVFILMPPKCVSYKYKLFDL